jgi:hypothetical protein
LRGAGRAELAPADEAFCERTGALVGTSDEAGRAYSLFRPFALCPIGARLV